MQLEGTTTKGANESSSDDKKEGRRKDGRENGLKRFQSNWMIQVVQNREVWKILREASVQQWTFQAD